MSKITHAQEPPLERCRRLFGSLHYGDVFYFSCDNNKTPCIKLSAATAGSEEYSPNYTALCGPGAGDTHYSLDDALVVELSARLTTTIE